MLPVVIVVADSALGPIESLLIGAGWTPRRLTPVDSPSGRAALLVRSSAARVPRLVRQIITSSAAARPPAVLIVGHPAAPEARQAIRRALEVGAADFVDAAALETELVLRLNAVARRRSTVSSPRRIVGDVAFDRRSRTLRHDNLVVSLTPNEYLLFACLAHRPGQPVSRGTIQRVLSRTSRSKSANIVDVYIVYLRRKLARINCRCAIRTIRGTGYVLDVGLVATPRRESISSQGGGWINAHRA